MKITRRGKTILRFGFGPVGFGFVEVINFQKSHEARDFANALRAGNSPKNKGEVKVYNLNLL